MPAYKRLRCVTFQTALRGLLGELLGFDRAPAKATDQRHGPPILHTVRADKVKRPVGLGMDCDRGSKARIGRERDQGKLCVSREKPVDA